MKENIREILHNIGFGNVVLDMTPKELATSEKIDKLDFYLKRKLLYLARLKRWPTEWEQIVASNVSDKGSISRIYKEIQQKQLNSKMGKGLEQTCLQRHRDGQ